MNIHMLLFMALLLGVFHGCYFCEMAPMISEKNCLGEEVVNPFDKRGYCNYIELDYTPDISFRKCIYPVSPVFYDCVGEKTILVKMAVYVNEDGYVDDAVVLSSDSSLVAEYVSINVSSWSYGIGRVGGIPVRYVCVFNVNVEFQVE